MTTLPKQVASGPLPHAGMCRQTFLTFRLGNETFAMEVGCVREILDLCRITRVPASPAHMLGVVNVRGITTAVMDLRHRFGLGSSCHPAEARIIIMEFPEGDSTVVVGGLADAVREVIDLEDNEISPAPTLGMRWPSELVRGVARRGEHFIIILDIARLLLSPAEQT